MSELVLCKLGGSILTDKQHPGTPRHGTIARLAGEVAQALQERRDLALVLGHGSGSFGHVVASQYHVRQGITGDEDWWGYVETGAAATRLNRIVTDAFLAAGVPVVSIQVSASARCRAGELEAFETYPLQEALKHKLVPLIYGDVAFDQTQGATIVSTEAEFVYLARRLHPARIILVGQVHGVYDGDPLLNAAAKPIPHITPDNLALIEARLGTSHGIDVTGGMLSKVRTMVHLVEGGAVERVQLISGQTEGTLSRALLDVTSTDGTLITKQDEQPI